MLGLGADELVAVLEDEQATRTRFVGVLVLGEVALTVLLEQHAEEVRRVAEEALRIDDVLGATPRPPRAGEGAEQRALARPRRTVQEHEPSRGGHSALVDQIVDSSGDRARVVPPDLLP